MASQFNFNIIWKIRVHIWIIKTSVFLTTVQTFAKKLYHIQAYVVFYLELQSLEHDAVLVEKWLMPDFLR